MESVIAKLAAAGWTKAYEALAALQAQSEEVLRQFHKGLLTREDALAELQAVQAQFAQAAQNPGGPTDAAYRLQQRLENAVARLQPNWVAPVPTQTPHPDVTKKALERLRRRVQDLTCRADLVPEPDDLIRGEAQDLLEQVAYCLRAGRGRSRMKLVRLESELRALLGEDPPMALAAYQALLVAEERRQVNRLLRDNACHPVMPATYPPQTEADWIVGYSDASLRNTLIGPAAGLGGCLYGPHGLLFRFSAWRKGKMSSDTAERAALLYLLEAAATLGVRRLKVHVDNKVAAASDLSSHRPLFEVLEVHWLPRKHNRMADYLARLAISRGLLPGA